VQQARGDGGRVQLHLRQHLGHLERVDDVRFAGGPHLACVMLYAELPCLADEGDIFTGAVGLNLLEQRRKTLVDGDLGGSRLEIAQHNRSFPRRRRGRAGNLWR